MLKTLRDLKERVNQLAEDDLDRELAIFTEEDITFHTVYLDLSSDPTLAFIQNYDEEESA